MNRNGARLALLITLAVASCSDTDPPLDRGADLAPDRLAREARAREGSIADAAAGAPVKLAAYGYLIGVTTDDQIVYQNPTTSALLSLPLSGGQPKTLSTAWTVAAVNGKVVIILQLASSSAKTAKLLVATGGSPVQLATSTVMPSASTMEPWTSADGTWVVYTDGAIADGSSADIHVGKTDGSGSKKIGRALFSAACPALGRFTPSGKLFVQYCEVGTASTADAGVPAPDGGTSGPALSLALVDPASGAITPIASLPPGQTLVAWDRSFTRFLVRDAAKALTLHSAGATPISIDADVGDVGFLPDGKAIVYNTGAGALKRASASAPPAPTVLMASGALDIPGYWVGGLYAPAPGISPDGKWVYVADKLKPSGVGSLLLASTETPGSPLQLAPDNAMLIGDPFSPDSQLLSYFTAATTIDGTGTLVVRPVSGGAATEVATDVWLNTFAAERRLVFTDHHTPGAGGEGTADLRFVDLAKSGAKPQLLATQIDETFYLDSTRTRIIWAAYQQADAARSGIFLSTLP